MNLDPIIVIGGGFVGVPTARRLAKAGHKVTLINPADRFLFTPRLIDALAGVGNPATWTEPLTAIAARDGFTFLQATVTDIDRKTQHVTCVDSQGGSHKLPYGAVVMSPGAKTNFYNIPGAETHATCLKSLEDVEKIHQKLQASLQLAINDKRPIARERLLSIIVVGAGPSGVESAVAIKEKLNALCAAEDASLCKLIRVTIIQAAPQILPGFPLRLARKAERILKRSGITVSTHDPVKEVRADGVMTTNLGFLPASMVVWCAGIMPSPLPIRPEVHRDPQGNILVDRSLRVDTHLFAAGDAVLYKENDLIIPKNAQTAMLMASSLATNVHRVMRDRNTKPFHYVSHGTIIWLGRTGILNIKGFIFQSRFVPLLRHIFYLLRFWEVVGEVR